MEKRLATQPAWIWQGWDNASEYDNDAYAKSIA
jgi:hypothetical protein